MSREEDLIRSTTRAIASTVREVPPLRLESDADELWSLEQVRHARAGSARQRHWRSWLAPLTAAAVVAALAIALVIIRDLPNGSVVPPNPTASTGPGAIPRYYVAIRSATGEPDGLNTVVVGDSLTGKAIETFGSNMTFQSVTAANDDRTFVLYAVAKSGGSEVGAWFEVHLAPGTAHPARLTALPIQPVKIPLGLGSVPQYGVFAMALSGSGQELAVAEVPSAAGGVAVKVFSLATGDLLHDWTTNNPSVSDPVAEFGVISPAGLSWIDQDHALALTTTSKSGSPGMRSETVRSLNVDGPPTGDLLADSKVIWITPSVGKESAANPDVPCGVLLLSRTPLFVSADGKTVSCGALGQQAGSSSIRMTVTFSTYQLAPGTTAAGQGMIAYQVTRQEPTSSGASGLSALLWVSPSGGTLIGKWGIGPSKGSSVPFHIGVISHGMFTPLRFPADLAGAKFAF